MCKDCNIKDIDGMKFHISGKPSKEDQPQIDSFIKIIKNYELMLKLKKQNHDSNNS